MNLHVQERTRKPFVFLVQERTEIMMGTNAREHASRDAQAAVRDAHDAEDDKRLKRNPADDDAKLDVALDESFPSSDAPSNTQPEKGKDPPPSSGFDEESERLREQARATD